MRATDLLESLDYISEDLLARSEQPLEQKRSWLRTAAAACLVLAVAAAALWIVLNHLNNHGTIPGSNSDTGVSDPMILPKDGDDAVRPSGEEEHDPGDTSEETPAEPSTDEHTPVDPEITHDMTAETRTTLAVKDCIRFDGGASTTICLDLSHSFTPNVLWDSVEEDTMPVYQNMAYIDTDVPELFYYKSEMEVMIYTFVNWLQAKVLQETVQLPSDYDLNDRFSVTDDTPVRMNVQTDKAEIEMTGEGVFTVHFTLPLDPPADLPQQTYASREDELLALTYAYSKLLNEALCSRLLGTGGAISAALQTEGDQASGETITTCYAWKGEDGPDCVSSLVNHEFNRLELRFDENNRLTELRYFVLPIAKLGDFQTITYDQALKELEAGNALSLVSADAVKGGTLSRDRVADVSLTYLPMKNSLYSIPFYCFLAELSDQTGVPEGTVRYGQYYVPMLDPSVLSDYPPEGDHTAQEAASDDDVIEYRGMRFYPAVQDVENGVYRAPEGVEQDAGLDCPVSMEFDGKLLYAKSRFLDHSIFILYTDDSFDGEITVVKHQDKAVYDASYADYYHFGYEKITVNDIPVQVFGNAMACWEYDGYYYDLSAMGQEHIAIGVDLKALLPYFVGID